MGVWIGLLGEVTAHLDGRPLELGPAKQRCVLAALAVDAPRLVTADRLVERVWGTEPPRLGRRTLYSYLSRLRGALSAAGVVEIVSRSGGYALALDQPGPATDLHRFRDLCAQARAGADDARAERLLTEALELWRGQALTGLDGEWVEAERDRLRRERLDAEHALTEVRLRLGHGPDLVAGLRARADADVLDERLAGQYMLALSRAGRAAEALAHYQRVRERLAEELGTDPGAELRRVHAGILRTVPEDGHGPSYLPYRTPDFVGRERELAEVLGALRGGAAVLVHGMAGVGKTALAIRACHDVAADFPDGRVFVDLHGYSPAQEPLGPAAALAALLAQVDVPPAQHPDSLDGRAALWRARTAGRRFLVLVDNVASADQLRPLLPGPSGSTVLATSRRRLTAVDGMVPVPVDLLPEADADTLFALVSGRTDAGAVARLCGGLPLAIRIAAARLRNRPMWTTDDFVRRLGGHRSKLPELRTTDQDLAAVFALSYRELAGDRQRLFRLLGLHPGTRITPDAAAALAGTTAAKVEPLLEDLHDIHLLSQEDRFGYRLHDLLAEHARSLGHPDEAPAALDRLLDHYRDGGDEHWHHREEPNLRAVVELALERQRYEHAWRIADHTARHLRARGRRDDFLAVARGGLEAARVVGEPHALVRSLDNLANAHWECGDLERAMSTAGEWLRVATAMGDPVARSASLSRIGTLYGMFGDYDKAVTTYEVALAEEAPDYAVTALLLGNLSHAQEMRGDFAAALDTAIRSRKLREHADDTPGWVLSTAQLALVLARLGRREEALLTAREAVDTAVRIDYLFGEAWARTDYAEVLLAADLPEEARQQAERACALLTQPTHPLLLTLAANALGDAHRALGQPNLALDHYCLAHDTAERIGYRRQQDRARAGHERARAELLT
ncbi:AfsR/SARP family transcriptional regulator [Saccharothrix variisporea]|uniref:DNA-binding SARP family transcriptional activator n=1 Tax=Saccharothrix variisporea TaxID=543527 RepID=A0A495X8R7_9PSEU|nr:AfsR/SARP family transcriptional regulator [Saccharothrix variisporea]RKT69264.1 DNA-binding SARP family transcriptional activator [Saccharothrix variisporea]